VHPNALRNTTPSAPADAAATTCDFRDDASMARLRRKLFCFAQRELRSADQAEDVTQDTMIALFTAPERYRGDARFDVYAIGVLRHKIADHFRASSREMPVAPETLDALRDGADDAHGAGYAGHAMPDPAAAADAVRRRERFWQTLRACLDTMPEAHRAAFVLRDVQEWSMGAVCAHLGVTPTHVSVMAHRARAHLQAHWPPAEREFAPA
jgi:RNA polymerase sigma-70 factor (ECF subfamily)